MTVPTEPGNPLESQESGEEKYCGRYPECGVIAGVGWCKRRAEIEPAADKTAVDGALSTLVYRRHRRPGCGSSKHRLNMCRQSRSWYLIGDLAHAVSTARVVHAQRSNCGFGMKSILQEKQRAP
jgi:endonuclease I